MGERARFATTQWSLVAAAAEPRSAPARSALSELCEGYWYPLYAFARRSGASAEDARDLTQGFFAELLEKGYLAQADRDRGRFRTFLMIAGLATLAQELGHRVSGSDANAYPPMSDVLRAAGIEVRRGYDPAHLEPAPDCVVVGNALSRGNPAVEHLLDSRIPFESGPAWIARHVLPGRRVAAVAGTHGKTTTSSLLAWVLEHAGLEPGFLIGGLPHDLGRSARVGRPRSSWTSSTSGREIASVGKLCTSSSWTIRGAAAPYAVSVTP